MDVRNNDDILYHYTSVETLALILKNRTFRLNNLTDMDDLEEGNSTDFENVGRFIFSSSWTDSSEESIPLWNLYTPEMRGIRIGLPKYFFTADFDKENSRYNGIQKHCEDNYSKDVLFLDEQIRLIEVFYTDKHELLCPEIFTELKDDKYLTFKFDLDKVVKHKRTVWEFQKEWRYCAKILPFTIKEFENMRKEKDEGVESIGAALRTHNIFPYIDIPVEPEMLSKMTILCGPKMSEANKIIVQSLIDTYNPTIKIEDSKLRIR